MSAAELLAGLRAKNPDVVRLATDLSLVARPDAEIVRLLRRARIPGSSVELELLLWSSPLVSSRGARSLLLRSAIFIELRTALAADQAELSACWSIAAPWVKRRAPLSQCEDRLLYLSLLREELLRDVTFDDVANQAGSIDEEIERRVGSVVSTMREQVERRDALAAWTARVMPLLPERVRARDWVRLLVAVAATRVPAAKTLLSPPPDPQHVQLANQLSAKQPARSVWVSRVDEPQGFGALEISPVAVPRGVAWQLPQDPPTLVVDDDRTIRISALEITRIALDRDESVLETSDGRRWLAARPQVDEAKRGLLAAIPRSLAPGAGGIAYLVDEGYAVTSYRALGRSEVKEGTRIRLSFAHQDEANATVILTDSKEDLVLLQLAKPWGTPFTPLNATANSYWFALSPHNDEPPLVGTVNLDRSTLTLARDVAVPDDWRGAPFFCGGAIAGHIERITDRTATFRSASTVKQWLRRAREDDPISEMLDPPWRPRRIARRYRNIRQLARVGFCADTARLYFQQRGGAADTSDERPLIFTQLEGSEVHLDQFVRVGGNVYAARVVAFDPGPKLAALVTGRACRLVPLASAVAPDPKAPQGPVVVLLPGGRRLVADLDNGMLVHSESTSDGPKTTFQSYTLRIDLKTQTDVEEESETLTSEAVNAAQEAADKAERPPRCAPVVDGGRLIGLIDLDNDGDDTTFKVAAFVPEHLKPIDQYALPRPGGYPPEDPNLPRVWHWPGSNKAGILDVSARTPGLDGSEIRLVSPDDGFDPHLTRLMIVAGDGPRVTVRGPTAETVKLRPLGHPVQMVKVGADEPWQVLAPALPGRSSAWSMRRGLRFAVELVRQLKPAARTHTSAGRRVVVRFDSGLEEADVGEIADRVAFEWGPSYDVVEWFPERGVLELLVSDADRTWDGLRQNKSGVLGKLAYAFEETELDLDRGLYGWASDHAGRRLDDKRGPNGRFLEVSASNGVPVTGRVSFFTSSHSLPLRVQARDGVARVPFASSGVVGALVEREGLELELHTLP